jgi:integrase/recombinase XerD
MEIITLTALHHRNTECIGIYFANKIILSNAVRKIPGIKWSQGNKCWYLPLSKPNHTLITTALTGKATIDNSQLKVYLQKKKITATAGQSTAVVKTAIAKTAAPKTVPAAINLSAENTNALEKFIQQLYLKAYSPSTVKTYRNEFIQLLQLIKNKPVHRGA